MAVPITALYLAIFAVFGIVLALGCGVIRGREGISIGDGGRADLHLAIRRHGNFIENVPFIMLMFAALELNGASAGLLHGLGLGLIASRVLHARGLKADSIESIPRAVGAGGTTLITLIAAGSLAWQFFGG